MRRPLLLAPLLLLAGGLAVCPRPARGCAIAPPPNGTTSITAESALIVYDAATHTEHFIRTAGFQSTSAEFGFLVPTPTRPELAEASAEVFGELGRITERRTEVRRRAKEPEFGCALKSTVFVVGAASPDPAARGGGRVVEQKRVGDFDAAVLQASDPARLRDWLTANGYDARPELVEWFKPYTADGWFLTAFKIAADSPAAGGQTLALTSTAVRISFQTDRPFYPYREPADMQAATGPRSLRLFVLSDARVSGTLGTGGSGGKPWPGRTEWSNRVPADKLASAVSKGKLPEAVGGREWHLTEFLDPSSPRPGTEELYLSDAADQSPVERPPDVVWEEYDPWPWVFGTIAVLALVLRGFGVWRTVRTKG